MKNKPNQLTSATQKTARQSSLLLKSWCKNRFAFGGALLKGSHPKKKRPFYSKLPLHIVMRSTKARGASSFLLHNAAISKILHKQSIRQCVKIYSLANAGNHLHFVVQAPSKNNLSAFLKAISGRIAELLSSEKGFWDARPFSRVLSWGRDFKNTARYISLNSTEMIGMNRHNVRAMFDQIQKLLHAGVIPKSSNLIAAGFA